MYCIVKCTKFNIHYSCDFNINWTLYVTGFEKSHLPRTIIKSLEIPILII